MMDLVCTSVNPPKKELVLDILGAFAPQELFIVLLTVGGSSALFLCVRTMGTEDDYSPYNAAFKDFF